MTTPAIGPQATITNIAIEQGATFRARFRWLEDGVPQSLADYTVTLGVSRRRGRPPLFTVSSTDAEEIQLQSLDGSGNPLVGVIDVTIPPDKTALLNRNGFYDLVLVNQGDHDDIVRLYEGTVTIHLAVVPFVAAT